MPSAEMKASPAAKGGFRTSLVFIFVFLLAGFFAVLNLATGRHVPGQGKQ